LVKGPVYRSFRRRVLLATAALFLLGLLAALLLRHGENLWTVVLWTAVCSPLLVALATAVMLPLGRMAAGLGLGQDRGELRLRSAAILWMLTAILLPWIAAWIAADRIGLWFMAGHPATEGGDAYLWAVRLLAGLVTYALASAIGVLIAFLIDSRTSGEPS
jgi:hypothetical protein